MRLASRTPGPVNLNSEMRTTADLRETDCQEAARKGEQSESNYTEHTDKEGLMIEVQITR